MVVVVGSFHVLDLVDLTFIFHDSGDKGESGGGGGWRDWIWKDHTNDTGPSIIYLITQSKLDWKSFGDLFPCSVFLVNDVR